MPSGYTKFIEDGTVTTAEDFLKLCSRQFGVYNEYPDEPLSPEIPTQIEKNPLFEANITKAKEALDEVIHETDWETKLSDYASSLESDYAEAKEKYDNLVSAYKSIRSGISKWEPADTYKPIKAFALSQIDLSLNSLVNPEYMNIELEKVKKYSADFYKDKMLMESSEKLTDEIQRSQTEDIRIEKRQKYLEGFLEALATLQ